MSDCSQFVDAEWDDDRWFSARTGSADSGKSEPELSRRAKCLLDYAGDPKRMIEKRFLAVALAGVDAVLIAARGRFPDMRVAWMQVRDVAFYRSVVAGYPTGCAALNHAMKCSDVARCVPGKPSASELDRTRDDISKMLAHLDQRP